MNPVAAVPALRVHEAETLRRTVGFEDLVDPVARAFADFSAGLGEAPISVFAPAGEAGDVHVKSAWLQGRPVFTVKVAGWFAARAVDGRSAGTGYLAVHDARTGDLLALLRDEHHLTDIRTAAAGAVAARLLARADARVVAVLGTGVQAYLQVLAARAVRPVDTVHIWGRDPSAAARLRDALVRADRARRGDHGASNLSAATPALTVSVAADPESAVRAADIVVTATAGRLPIVAGRWLRPGGHITAVGADDPTKAELDPDCFRRADLVVVDSRADALRFAGDLRDAVAAAALTAVDAELGELVAGSHPGRRNDDQITIAKLIGIGVQDLAAAETALALLAGPPRTGPAPASAMDLR